MRAAPSAPLATALAVFPEGPCNGTLRLEHSPTSPDRTVLHRKSLIGLNCWNTGRGWWGGLLLSGAGSVHRGRRRCLEVYRCQRFEAGIHVSNGFSSVVCFSLRRAWAFGPIQRVGVRPCRFSRRGCPPLAESGS